MNMNLSDEKYEDLVHLIYAVLDQPDGWLPFCKALTSVLDATFIQIIALDRNYQALSFSATEGAGDGVERDAAELVYLKHPVKADPRWDMVLREDTVGWIQCHTFVSDEFVAQSELYQDILLPVNSRYLTAYKLLYDPNVCVVMGIHTSQDRKPLGQNELAFLNRLLPHLQRVISLQKHIYQFSTGALVGYALINKLHQPMVLLNLEGGVVHTNAAADELLNHTQIMKIKDKQFCFPEPYMQQFQQNCTQLEKLYRAGQLTADQCPVDACMKIMDNNGETLYTFSSLMIPEQSMGMFGVRPLVMLTLYHPSYAPAVDTQLLSTVFGLTPAESRVAMLLMEGLAIKEIASKNDVKLDTVKKQMQAIYDKTATHRQSDLVKLLLNLPRQITSPSASTNQSPLRLS